jgi:hypothetical protein
MGVDTDVLVGLAVRHAALPNFTGTCRGLLGGGRKALKRSESASGHCSDMPGGPDNVR